jgi:tripartite-type tricarboxylate transporter receptor subunit TctC
MKAGFVSAALGLIMPLAATTIVQAQAVADFYKGKTVTLAISSAPGGGYDALGRAVSRHMGKHIPGNPQIIVQNMPGAGGIVAGNTLYRISAKDGTVIAILQNTVPFEPLFGTKEATFDATHFNWLGTPSVEVGLIALWHASPVNTIDDLRQRETTFGASGANSTPSFYARLLNETLGTKMKIVSGYQGQTDAFLAMERGEVEGYPSTFYSALTSTKPDWLRDKKVKFIVQYGPNKEPNLPDVPFAPDLISKPEDKQLLEVAFAALAIGRPFLAPPGVPADRVATLRKALADTFKDKEFIAEAERVQLSVDQPRTGEELQSRIAEAYKAPPELIARLRKLAGQ